MAPEVVMFEPPVVAPEVLLVSRKLWDGLPAAEQTALREAARASVGDMREQWRLRESRARDTAMAAGVIVNDVDKTAFAAALRHAVDGSCGGVEPPGDGIDGEQPARQSSSTVPPGPTSSRISPAR